MKQGGPNNPNTTLAEATGLPVPETTRDIVGDMMRFEAGEMDDDEIKELLSGLHEDGTLAQLQGVYGRTAAAMGIL